MTPAEMVAKLDELHAAGKFFGFSIWPTNDGLQVSLATTSKTNWRIRRSDTPSEGMALVLDMDFMDNGVSEDGREPELLAPPLVDEPEWIGEAAAEHEAAKIEEPGIFD